MNTTKEKTRLLPGPSCYQYINYLLPCTANLSVAAIFLGGTTGRTEAHFPYKPYIYPYIFYIPYIYSHILLLYYFTVPFVPFVPLYKYNNNLY